MLLQPCSRVDQRELSGHVERRPHQIAIRVVRINHAARLDEVPVGPSASCLQPLTEEWVGRFLLAHRCVGGRSCRWRRLRRQGPAAMCPDGGNMTSPRSVREILHAIAMGRRPKAIPPGFGETDPTGTRFFNIAPTGAQWADFLTCRYAYSDFDPTG